MERIRLSNITKNYGKMSYIKQLDEIGTNRKVSGGEK